MRLIFTWALAAAAGTCAAADNAGRPLVNPRDGVINLRTGDVDASTLANELSAQAFTPGAVYLLRLDGPMDAVRRQRLVGAGITLKGYLPTNFFLADLSRAAPAAVRAIPYVLGAYRYDRAWKLDPNLAQGPNRVAWATAARQQLAAQGKVGANLWLFAGENPDAALASVHAVPGATVTSTELVGGTYSIGVTIPAAAVAGLADLPSLQFVEEFPEYTARSNATTRWVIQSDQLNNTPLYDRGLTGTGQVMGVIDGWVGRLNCAFNDPAHPIGPTHRKILAYNTATSYDLHGTHVACTALGDDGTNGNSRGVAYGAKMVFNTWPDVTEESNFQRFNLHFSQGARVHTNSWGADWLDAYDGGCRAIDTLQHDEDDNLIIFAVSDMALVHNPENAKNSLAVSASGNAPNEQNFCFGGAGPTQDGRRKPEVMAPGCNIVSASGSSGCGTTSLTGTSMAAPAVSGLAVLTRQYYTSGFYPTGAATPANAFTPSGALVKATLINGAQNMTGIADYPNVQEGWGRVLGDASLYFAGDARQLLIHDVRNDADTALDTGQTAQVEFAVSDSSQPLRITMVYHDAPALVNASFAPVNDLDLSVTDPAGQVYLGNNFSGGYSSRGGSADPRNNTEQVHVAAPITGRWRVTVSARAVNEGPQGYALVVTGPVGGVPCTGDFNQDGGTDGADVEAFFHAWETGDDTADIDLNGGVDGGDVEAFFAAWEQGC